MKKKVVVGLILLIVFVMIFLTGCGNKRWIDFQYTFNYAYIELPNGEIVDGKVEDWDDFEGDQLQIQIGGIVYLTSANKAVLIYNPTLN